MPKKCYAIPINKDGEAFCAVKALTNPYQSNQQPYTAGCPSIFGDNIDAGATMAGTLTKEALEESYRKVQLIEPFLNVTMAGTSGGVEFAIIHQVSRRPASRC